MPLTSCLFTSPLIPRAALAPEPLQYLQVTTPCCTGACAFIPRAACAPKPLQYIQVTMPSSLRACFFIPRAALTPEPLQCLQVTACRGAHKDILIQLKLLLLELLQQRQVATPGRQAHDPLGPQRSNFTRYFLFAAKSEVINRRGLATRRPAPEIRLQSKTRLPAPRRPRPRHQLLLLLTKVPAAPSQGEEVVLVELVEDLLPHLRRELVKTLGVLDLTRVALAYPLAFSLGRRALTRGRRSLAFRHLPSPRRANREADARSLASRGALLVSRPRSPFATVSKVAGRSPLSSRLFASPRGLSRVPRKDWRALSKIDQSEISGLRENFLVKIEAVRTIEINPSQRQEHDSPLFSLWRPDSNSEIFTKKATSLAAAESF